MQGQDAADRARLRYATAVVQPNQPQINLRAALGLIDQANVDGRPTAALAVGTLVAASRAATK